MCDYMRVRSGHACEIKGQIYSIYIHINQIMCITRHAINAPAYAQNDQGDSSFPLIIWLPRMSSGVSHHNAILIYHYTRIFILFTQLFCVEAIDIMSVYFPFEFNPIKISQEIFFLSLDLSH